MRSKKEITKKVIICLESLNLGGAERQAVYLAKFLHTHPSTQVEVLAFSSPGRAAEILDEAGVHWSVLAITFSYKKKVLLRNSIRLWAELRKRKADVILPFTYGPNLLCGLVWRFTRAKVCLWNQRDEGRRIKKSRIENFAIRNATHIVSNSIEGKLFIIDNFNIPDQKIKVIYNGIQLPSAENTKAWWYNELKITNDYFIAVMVASLHPYKDHATLIKAWRLVVDQFPDRRLILLLAGRFYQTHYAHKALAFDLKLHDYIRFLGGVDDISGLLSITDLGLFSSNHEGCPNAVLEYMAASLPVVATNINGSRDALGEDYAFLAPPNSPKIFAERISDLIRHPNLLSEIGNRNKEYVETNFAVERMHQDYVNLIT